MSELVSVTRANVYVRSRSDGIAFGLRFMGPDALMEFLYSTLGGAGNVSEEREASNASEVHVPQVQGQAPPSGPSPAPSPSSPSVTYDPAMHWIVIALGAAAGYAALNAKNTHGKTPFDLAFNREGATFKIDPDLLRAIAKVESNMNPLAVSKLNPNGTHDRGLMQINDRTAEALGVNAHDLFDPDIAIHTAARLLNSIRTELGDKYNTYTWVAAYNVGSPTVKERGIVNPAYVGHVMLEWQMFKVGHA